MILFTERHQITSAGSEALCSLHSDKLRLFCVNHKLSVCGVCRNSKTHRGHRFRPIVEAAQDDKEELQESLKPVQEELKLFAQVKEKCHLTAKHNKVADYGAV